MAINPLDIMRPLPPPARPKQQPPWRQLLTSPIVVASIILSTAIVIAAMTVRKNRYTMHGSCWILDGRTGTVRPIGDCLKR